MTLKEQEIERLARRLVDWLEHGVPTSCRQPPWQATLDRIDEGKIKRLGRKELTDL